MGKKRKKKAMVVVLDEVDEVDENEEDEENFWEVDFIKARRLENGVPKYLIRWKGFDAKHDTWEPLSNLSGLEPDLAAFEAKQKKEAESYRKAQEEKRSARSAARAGKQAAGSSAAAATVEAPIDNILPTAASTESGFSGRKTAQIWGRYKSTNVAGVFECLEENCGSQLRPCGGPSALWNHHRSKHKQVFQELKGFLSEEVAAAVDGGVSLFDPTQTTLRAQRFSDERKKECDMACARWLVKSARPLTLPECDTPFGAFIYSLTRGAWQPPNRRNVAECMFSKAGKLHDDMKKGQKDDTLEHSLLAGANAV